jgi:hypothetical protein
MTRRFHILGSTQPRPGSKATLFCDGSADQSFREGLDLELSHWVPNRTPAEYRADTSTEICLRFAESGRLDDFDLVVNNHADVDGVLSVFSLVDPELALAHRADVICAAEMGDFWGDGDGLALALFQSLTLLLARLDEEDADSTVAYGRSFDHVREVLRSGGAPDMDAARAALEASVTLIEEGLVTRLQINEHLTSYVVPEELAAEDLDAALRVPEFNAPLDGRALLLPQARNRFDKERVQLVSIATERGWHHDLWYPGYMWADTENVWRAPGFRFADSTNAWFYGFPELMAAVEGLRRAEEARGHWTVVDRLLPFKTLPGRNFPVVVSFLEDGECPATSSLEPARVAALLAPAFA